MFNSVKVKQAYKNLVGWKKHFSDDIVISDELQKSETGEYYQEKHSALSLDKIQTLIPDDYKLNEYLSDVVESATTEMLNDLLQYRQLHNYGKTLLENKILLNKYGYGRDKIVNQGRFVGFQVRLMTIEGLAMVIKSIGLQMDAEKEFDLYIYHSSKKEPLKVVKMKSLRGNNWDWTAVDFTLTEFNLQEYNEGVFVIGYYQQDLGATMAINYTNFDWDVGECGTCNSDYAASWRSITKFYHIYPIYVPSGEYVKGEMFEMESAIYSNNKSWGLNLRLSAVCDLTDFFIENRLFFKNLLQWKVVTKVLQMMKFSNEVNNIEEELKMMIIRDLEGDKETHLTNTPMEYKNELKAVSWNISKINKLCLQCENHDVGPFYSNL